MQHHQHTLKNGLTIVGEYSATARSLAMGFFVKTGARDESDEVSGVSHFLEHMMFKGTTSRSPEDINRDFDALGARYNAFTSEEETVFYGSVLPQFQGEFLEILADMMRPALRAGDFDLEKKVILEEIAMYRDRPISVLFDELKTRYYGGHALGNSILGSDESIKALTRDQMHSYFENRYAANNSTLVVVGNYDWDNVVADTQKWCGHWNHCDVPRAYESLTGQSGTYTVREDRFNRVHIGLMGPGFATQDERRIAASIACTVIGAGESSRLYWALVHPGIAEAAQLGHDAQDSAGAFYGIIAATPENAQVALDIYRAEIDKSCRDGLSLEEIERAKRRIASAITIGAETPMGRLRAVGFDWLYRKEQISPQDALDKVLNTTPEQVNEAIAHRPFENPLIVGLGQLADLT